VFWCEEREVKLLRALGRANAGATCPGSDSDRIGEHLATARTTTYTINCRLPRYDFSPLVSTHIHSTMADRFPSLDEFDAGRLHC